MKMSPGSIQRQYGQCQQNTTKKSRHIPVCLPRMLLTTPVKHSVTHIKQRGQAICLRSINYSRCLLSQPDLFSVLMYEGVDKEYFNTMVHQFPVVWKDVRRI